MTLQAEKELRQRAEQAHIASQEAADAQEGHIQALQHELGQASAKIADVPTIETQLTAAKSQVKKVLEDLQVSWALYSAVYSERSLQHVVQPQCTLSQT